MRKREVHVVAAQQDVPPDRDAPYREPRRRAGFRDPHQREIGGAAAHVADEHRTLAAIRRELANRALAAHRGVERGGRLLEEHRTKPCLLRCAERELARDLVEGRGKSEHDVLLSERRIREITVPGLADVGEDPCARVHR